MKTAAEIRFAAQALRVDRAARTECAATEQLDALDVWLSDHIQKHSADPAIVRGAVTTYTGSLNERALARLKDHGYVVEDRGDGVATAWMIRWPDSKPGAR